ncbi:MAG: cell division protein FtsA, partial [Candidatus Magasanikbacteria bacterium]
LTGGGVKVPGIVDLAKNELKLPVTLGYPIGVGGMGEYINDLGYATSVGLVKWGALLHGGKKPRPGIKNIPIGKMADGMKKFFHSLMP